MHFVGMAWGAGSAGMCMRQITTDHAPCFDCHESCRHVSAAVRAVVGGSSWHGLSMGMLGSAEACVVGR